ncbi:uncharacterized protein [Ptychodera flava]|uniref:uncharacterized protein isoform X2 n=1 Tax=Ptychodera flava TaxID=63121 RepID=UPI00396A150B
MVNQVLVVYLTLLLGIPTGADWTMYFDIMDAEYKGDREMIAHVFDKFPRFMCEDPVRMQVKMNDGEMTHLTSELFSIDSVEKGFPCLNVNHSDSVCDNYQVRYCCPGGHGAKWCLTSEELDHHPVKENYSIEIRENTKVDETVWKIPYGDVQGNDNTLNDVVATSVEIMSGNEKNRFSVSENNTSVILAGLLDADILSWYSLVIYLTFTNGSLWPVYLNINITDVYDWPLVYNSTCETRARIKNDDSLLQPFQIRIHGVSTEKIIRHYEDTTLVLNNTECNILLFGKTSRILNGYDAKKLQLKYHFEDGSNTFQADFAFLKDDDPAIKGYSSERDKKTFYLYYVVLRGINSHGPTKLTFEICMKDTGKLLYGWNRPIEYNVLGCPQSRYGARCQYECNCKNGASCHMWNGACKCQSGWWGPACDIPMKAIATLDTVVTVEEPTPLYSQMHFICSVTYMNVKSVIWKLNETVIREQPSRIETGTIDPDRLQNQCMG